MISIKRMKGDKVCGTGWKKSKVKRFDVGAQRLLFLLFQYWKRYIFFPGRGTPTV